MVEHVAFALPRHLVYAERSSPIQLPTHDVHQLEKARRTVSSTSLETPSETYQVHNTVNQIIHHPKFDTWFPSIRSCLQLNNQAWATFFRLREDVEAKSKLELFHSSIWHIPPDEIWTNVVHLRQEPSFYNVQSQVLAEVEDAYNQAHQTTLTHQVRTTSSDDLRRTARGASGIHSRLGPRLTFDTGGPNESTGQDAASQVSAKPTSIPSTLKPTTAVPNSGVSKNRTKQAPNGMCYKCPSQNCTKSFIRLAHYHKHLNKNHPDFGPQHPDHSPWMALRQRPPNIRVNSRSSNTARFEGQRHHAANLERGGLRTFNTSRRGSQVSTSSINSEAVSSSAVDEPMTDSFLGMMEMPSFETLVPDESSVWHMGGATIMNSVGGLVSGDYYTGLANNRVPPGFDQT